MAIETEDEELRRQEAARDADTELDAYNAELSGTLSGYRSKHLPEDHAGRAGASERRAAKDRAQMNALEVLLATDPMYRAAYERTFSTLQSAEQRTEAALDETGAALEQTTAEIEDMLARANMLPDGRRIYRDANGDVLTEDGQKIDGPELEGVVWREDAPSYEQIRAKRERIDELAERIEALRRYHTDVLGSVRDRLEDTENPPTAEELEEIDRLIAEQEPKLRADLEPTGQPHTTPQSVVTDIPKM